MPPQVLVLWPHDQLDLFESLLYLEGGPGFHDLLIKIDQIIDLICATQVAFWIFIALIFPQFEFIYFLILLRLGFINSLNIRILTLILIILKWLMLLALALKLIVIEKAAVFPLVLWVGNATLEMRIHVNFITIPGVSPARIIALLVTLLMVVLVFSGDVFVLTLRPYSFVWLYLLLFCLSGLVMHFFLNWDLSPLEWFWHPLFIILFKLVYPYYLIQLILILFDQSYLHILLS